MVKKKKLWRKTLPDKQSTKAAVEVMRSQRVSTDLFTTDTVGLVEKPKELYPSLFAKPKFPASMSKADFCRLKDLPIKRPRAEAGETFDLWAEDREAAPLEKSHIPAVLRPHPGTSYRPEALGHAQVLEKVAAEESRKEEDLKKHAEVVNSFRVVEEDSSPDLSAAEEEGETEFVKNRTVVAKYLTNTQRNVKERNKLKEKMKKMMAKQKKEQMMFEKAPKILGELERMDEQYRELREEKELRKKMKIELESTGELAPRIRMGKFRYNQPETVASLTPTDSLRKLKVKGNAVEERVDSFIRRKMVDLATPRPAKKVVIKDCSQNEREKAFAEALVEKKKAAKSGKITISSK
jgi:hypothetical protein